MSTLTVFLAAVTVWLVVSWLAWPEPERKPELEPRSDAVVHHLCGRGHEYRATVRDAMQHGCPDCAVIDGIIDRAYDALPRVERP